MTEKVMILMNPDTGEMKCKYCGYVKFANVRPNSGGQYYRGSWQCDNGCPVGNMPKGYKECSYRYGE